MFTSDKARGFGQNQARNEMWKIPHKRRTKLDRRCAIIMRGIGKVPYVERGIFSWGQTRGQSENSDSPTKNEDQNPFSAGYGRACRRNFYIHVKILFCNYSPQSASGLNCKICLSTCLGCGMNKCLPSSRFLPAIMPWSVSSVSIFLKPVSSLAHILEMHNLFHASYEMVG